MATKPKSPVGARGLRVIARPDSFWRAKRCFTQEPRVVPVSNLSEEDIEEIKVEKQLVVTEVEITDELALEVKGIDLPDGKE